ncbi:MAG: vitamin K epoxide reductase family protein [Thermoplasmata archaeon]|nr:vitamin K epoxide reductase family protein [Thermoplasmata archaeon]
MERPRRRGLDAETAYALLLVVLLGGLAAAGYAAYEVLNPGAAAVCSVNSHVSCAAVAASGHTTVAGVPDWAIGIAGYLTMFGVALLAFRTFDRRYLQGLAALSGTALVFVAYFVYNETVVIGSICPVCTTAHILDVVALALTLYLLRLSRPDPGEHRTVSEASTG